jgi:hypothetical protein
MQTGAVLTPETIPGVFDSKTEMSVSSQAGVITHFQQELKRISKEVGEIETKYFNDATKQEILEKLIQLAQRYEQIAVTDEKLGASLTSSLEIFINTFQKIKCLTDNTGEEAIIPTLDALDQLFQKKLEKLAHSSFKDQSEKFTTFFEKQSSNFRDAVKNAFDPQNNVERAVVIAINNKIKQQCDILLFLSSLNHIYSLLPFKNEHDPLYLVGKAAYDRLFQIVLDLLSMDDDKNQYKIAGAVETLKNLLERVSFLLAPMNEEPLDFRIELLKNITYRYFDPKSLSIAYPFEETGLGFYHFNSFNASFPSAHKAETNEDKAHLALILRIANRLAHLNKANIYPYQKLLRKLNEEFMNALSENEKMISLTQHATARKLSQPASSFDASTFKDPDDDRFTNILYKLFPMEVSLESMRSDLDPCKQQSDKAGADIVINHPKLNEARVKLLDLFTELYGLSQNRNFDDKTLHLLKLIFNEYVEAIKTSKNPAELISQMQAIKALYDHCYFGKKLTVVELEAKLALINNHYLSRGKAYFMLMVKYPSGYIPFPIDSLFNYLQKETAQAAIVLNLSTLYRITFPSPIWLPVKINAYAQALIKNFAIKLNDYKEKQEDNLRATDIETMIRRTSLLIELEKLNLRRGSNKMNAPFLQRFSKLQTKNDAAENMIYQGACEELCDLIATTIPDVNREKGLLAVLLYINGETENQPKEALHYFNKYPVKKMLKCGFYTLLGCTLIGTAVAMYIMTSGTSALISHSLIQIGCGLLTTAGVLDLIVTAYIALPSTLSKGLSMFNRPSVGDISLITKSVSVPARPAVSS